MPKVSIVVPCYNQEEFIADALESVLSQSFSDWECIIVNDGSSDGSDAIIRRYTEKDPRFLALTKQNGGVAAARNFGFSRARGELFVPLDGDDMIHRDFLRLAVERFEAQPDTVLVHPGTQRFGENRKVWRLPTYSYEKLLWQNMIVNTTMYRREAFISAGGYSSEMVYGYEDWEFYVRMLSPESKVQYVDAPLYLYRIKKISRSTELAALGKIEESQRLIYERNRDKYVELAANPINLFGKRMKDFAPSFTARYQRQARYIHAAYGAVIAGLLIVGALLVR
ncbi:glycosyltransferase family 2 protein [Paraburkholderia sp. HP33-1]|uniref:glycosyltransferase family 2 protein n=1 Tax=Paraburkholderia sp. HP33-1 TaxID=2883243 RepID=UPI001F2387E7|nr:glycosyltransferase family A protein [Paraburkholderia sp. HP33-1]